MSYRFMRTLVLFDLPTDTQEDKKHYRHFRKLLIQNGFFMLQQSVYTRMLITPSAQQSVINTIRKNKPPSGIVQVLCVTEKQFATMECIVGEYKTDIIDSDERVIIL